MKITHQKNTGDSNFFFPLLSPFNLVVEGGYFILPLHKVCLQRRTADQNDLLLKMATKTTSCAKHDTQRSMDKLHET